MSNKYSLKEVIYLYLLLIVTSIGCNNTSFIEKSQFIGRIATSDTKELVLEKSTPVQLSITERSSIVDIDEVVREMKYIKLESNIDCLIGHIDKIVFYDNNIYILDKKFSKAIHIFDLQGGHLKSINRQGKGPEEYVAIKDFCILNDSLLLYDDLGSKIMNFNKDGEYNYYFKAPFIFKEFSPFKEDELLYITRNSDNSFSADIANYSLLIGTKDSIRYKGFKNSSFLNEFNQTENFTSSEFDKKHFYSPLLSNNIYQIDTAGSYSIKYSILFPKPLTNNFISELTNSSFDRRVKAGAFYYFMGNYQENSEHVFLRYYPPGDNFAYAIYNKTNEELLAFESYKNPRNFIGFRNPIAVYDDYFVSSLDPSSLLSAENKEEIKRAIGNVSERDNPILILYKFK